MKKNNNKGFTLVELIIVIAILAVLTVALAPQFVRYVDRSRFAKDNNAAASIETAVVAAVIDVNSDEDSTNDIDSVTVTFNTTGLTIAGSPATGATATGFETNLKDVLKVTSLSAVTDIKVTNKQDYRDVNTFTMSVDKKGKVTKTNDGWSKV